MLACESRNKEQIEVYNEKSYFYHYRNLDSTEHYAKLAIEESQNDANVNAEAFNNLAFVCISKMDYQQASNLLSMQ